MKTRSTIERLNVGRWAILVLLTSIFSFSGCAEGPLWKTGYLSPKVRQRWADEEQIAASLYSKKSQMRNMVETSLAAGPQAQQETSEFLANVVSRDPILLMRIEATRLLGQLPTPAAATALQLASRDRESEVRMASVRSWSQRGDETAREMLSSMVREEPDQDVRIAATAALGRFSGGAVRDALATAIMDPDPAMQLRAAESLAQTTGQSFGNDIRAWQDYLKQSGGLPSREMTPTQSPITRTAALENDSPAQPGNNGGKKKGLLPSIFR